MIPFVGLLLMGWGAFNVMEGLVDHHLLGLHHVRTDSRHQRLWDLGFLLWGAAMFASGWVLTQREEWTDALPLDASARNPATGSQRERT